MPADENELIGWLMDRGRQIGVWAPGVLDRLARSGSAVLIPAETYRAWFEAKVPEKQRAGRDPALGPAAGKIPRLAGQAASRSSSFPASTWAT